MLRERKRPGLGSYHTILFKMQIFTQKYETLKQIRKYANTTIRKLKYSADKIDFNTKIITREKRYSMMILP